MVRVDAHGVCGQRRADGACSPRPSATTSARTTAARYWRLDSLYWRLDSRRPSPTKRTCGGPEGRRLSVRLASARQPRGARANASGTGGRARGARWKKLHAAVGGTPADVPARRHSDLRRRRCAPSRSITRRRLRPLAALVARPTARRRPPTTSRQLSERRRTSRAIARTARQAA
jgi:hypothetical protein